jgi:hypothetical protein
LNVRRIRTINRHPVESDKDCAPQSISDTEGWLIGNGDLDYSNDSEGDCDADDDLDIQHHNWIDDPQCAEPQDVSAAPNVPGLVKPTRTSKRKAEKVLVTVNEVETRRNKGGKRKQDRMRQWFTSFMQLDREFELEIYYGRMVSSL